MKRRNSKDAVYPVVLFLVLIAMFVLAFQCGAVMSQDKPSVSLRDFSGGLNTNTNPFLLKQNEFLQLHNFDITDEFGSISLRRGFRAVTDSFTRITGVDSIRVQGYVQLATVNIAPVLLGGGIGEELLIVRFDTTTNPLRAGGFWDGANGVDTTVGGVPHTHLAVINSYNVYPSANLDIGHFIVDDSTIFAVGDSFYVARDTTSVNIDTGKITGLYAFNDRNGRTFLLSIVPGFGSGGKWSSLMMSRQGEYAPNTRLWPYIYKDETPIWETWNNRVYIALPRQRPLIFDGDRARPLIPATPGQMEIIPLKTSGNINGHVRYALVEKSRLNDDTLKRIGYLSHEIELNNENALLFNFPRPVIDSTYILYPESANYLLCRTRGRPFETKKFVDSLFIVDSIIINDLSVLDTLTIIEDAPDDSLGESAYPFVGLPMGIFPVDTFYIDTLLKIDSNGFYTDLTFHAPGQPSFIRKFDTLRAGDWYRNDTSEAPIAEKLSLGVSYFVTLLDTLSGIMSDSSPNLIVALSHPVAAGGTDSTKRIVVGIPRRTARDSGLVQVLWRSHWYTAIIPDSFINQSIIIEIGAGGRFPSDVKIHIPTSIRVPVTKRQRTAFFPVTIITDATQDSVVDSIKMETLFEGDATSNTVLADRRWNPQDNRIVIANGFKAFKDHLFSWEGSRLFRSSLDTPIFRPFNDVAFNLDDGDENTGLAVLGPNLLTLKNRSITELFDPIAGLPTKGSQNNGIGCIAPHSLVEGNGSITFLSELGVVTLKASQFQPFGIQTGIISHNINDLILGRPGSKRSAADLKKAVGALVDDKYLLCFPVNADPSNDTVFVFHIPLNAWSTYDFSFHQATKYDTFTVEGLVQSNRLLFARNDDERIFEFGGSSFYIDSGDANAFIAGVFETRPLFTDPDYWAVRNIAMLRSSGAGSGVFHVLDQDGTSLTNNTVSLTTSLRVNKLAYKPHDFIWSTIRYNTGSVFADSLTIHGIDIWGRRLSRQITQ